MPNLTGDQHDSAADCCGNTEPRLGVAVAHDDGVLADANEQDGGDPAAPADRRLRVTPHAAIAGAWLVNRSLVHAHSMDATRSPVIWSQST